MVELGTDVERRQLRAIARRRMARSLLVCAPALAVWWVGSRWIARRWGLQPDIARFALLLALFFLPGLFAPAGLGARLARDARETPRLRWLNQERTDRMLARSRGVMVFCLGILLLLQCVTMLAQPSQAGAAPSSWDGMVWTVLTASLCLRWRPADLGDEGAQFRTLVAVNRAFLVTIAACLAAIVLDACRAVSLRPALEASLLAGSLTLQLSLVLDEHGTASTGE